MTSSHEKVLYKMWQMSFIRYHPPFVTAPVPLAYIVIWYNSMYYVYRSIQMHSYDGHHSVLISTVSKSADMFLISCPIQRISGQGYFDYLLMFSEQVARPAVSKIIYIFHLHIRGFINSGVPNVVPLVYMYSDIVIPGISLVSCYGINILFNIMYYLKPRNKKYKYISVWIYCSPGYLFSHIISKFIITMTILSLYIHITETILQRGCSYYQL